MKIIIDTDPGIDDAMAIYYAMASDAIDLVGMTTIFGNVTVAQAVNNALWLGESLGREVPVFEGAAEPLVVPSKPPSAQVHGDHGFGARIETPTRSQKADLSAAEHLVKAAAEAPGELTLCAIGPLTNVAQAIALDPGFVGNLRQLVIMGGSLDAGGNITPHAEANFWHDPHAAHQVLTAPGGGEVVIVGLDVTTKVPFLPDHYQRLEDAAPRIGGFLNEIGQFYMSFYETVTGSYQAFVHDASAVMACEGLEMFGTEAHTLAVETEGEAMGAMVRADHGGRRCTVCTRVDAEALVEAYLTVMGRLD